MANSELKNRSWNVPENILAFMRNQPDIPELDRNENIRKTGTVTYGQLKRILHDLKKMNKLTQMAQYNFYGGDLMKNWGIITLSSERNQINNREDATRIANDIGGLSGDRKNASIKRHTKNTTSPAGSLNLTNKPNSEKYSNASMFSPSSFKLTEQIKRMKKLM
jgi:hypothetical protein